VTPPDRSAIAAVRGAVPVRANRSDEILAATARLLTRLLEVNRLAREQIISAIFTATDDLDADFPAHAARRLGWTDVPLLNAREIPVPGAMKRVVRVLLTVSGVAPGARLIPVYLDEAAALRPDLSPAAPATGEPPVALRVAIIGLGQIGGSIGRALGRAGGWRRVGYDLDPSVTVAAEAAGAIDQAAERLEDACAGASLAVLATPVDTLPAVVAATAAALPEGAALLDTGSTRGPITPALEAATARGIRAVGGHPLAGSEGHGFAASAADRFMDTTFALVPTGAGVPEVVTRLVRDLGARPLEVTPERHDEALARTSHLPYLVACALRELGGEVAAQGLSGPGFRDMTRLAASDPRVARAYCRANAHAVDEAWHSLRESLDRSVERLEGAE
jgi:prephenate dehydrogenase